MDPVAEIKERISIVDLVERTGLTVVGQGKRRRTKEHPSLALYVDENTWHWFSQNAGGTVFDWWMREHRCDFKRALEDLAHLAGVELRPPTPDEQRALDDERARAKILNLACQHYHDVLMSHPAARAARDHCHGRGWSDETIRAHRLGYVAKWSDSVRDELPALSGQLHDAKLLDHPLAKAVLSIPPDSLVYPHLVGGQCVYLSGRGVEKKRHYNLPAELAGPKRLYRAEPAVGASCDSAQDANAERQEGVKQASGITVLVEGQADALSLAEWGYQAVALCGVEPGATLHQADGKLLQGISHVALDNDPAGTTKALDVAWRIDPLRRVALWPSAYSNAPDRESVPVKDGNDLLRAGGPAWYVEQILDEAQPALLLRARAARKARGEERNEHIAAIGRAWLALDDLAQADLGVELAREMGVGLSQFKRLMQAVADRAKAEDKDERSSPDSYETSAGGVIGDLVFEQCVRWSEIGEPSSYFAIRHPNGEIAQKPLVDCGGTTYVPYPAKIALIKRKVILFPSEPVDYGSQKALLNDVRSFIHRWLDVDPFYEQLASYYVMFTWLFDMFETLPYLRALGDYGTGKTRFIQTIGAVCYRPMFVSGASTASPIFRVMDMFKGTLVVDEADFAKSDAAVEIIKIVNVGYSRGGVVLRSEKDEESDSYYPSAKDVFGPKILATRK
ncbi:MAG: toprim domain-containing protein, partial [Polyangiaceae bacterium]|nr:toprim domain-containing protein [Polyangiaceae bacterium]